MHNNIITLARLVQQEITVLEILDTAVKVGLGAIISGFSAYVITRLQYKSNTEQEKRKRKSEILQEAAEQIESVNHVYLKYVALTKDALKLQRESLELSSNKKTEREQVKVEFFNVFKELTSAEAKLMLINEMGLAELVREFGDKVSAFRRTVALKDNPISDDEVDKLRVEILNTRKKLFKSLADTYKQA